MKQLFIGLMLICSINQASFAQSQPSNEYPFDIPPNSTNRYFWLDMGKGNKVEIFVNDINDLNEIKNMDSIIYGFLQDLRFFKDSLTDDKTIKRIDYNISSSEQRKLRFYQYLPKAESFVFVNDEVSSLKTAQDTINFVGKVNFVAKYPLRKAFDDTRYYKVRFLLNQVSDISVYMNDVLNQKIKSIQENVNKKKWDNNDDKSYSPLADPTIKANSIRGYNAGGDYLTLRASVDFQNYKNSFVPSITIGAAVILGGKNIKREFGLSVENHFSFERDLAGNNRTYINPFVTFNYARGYIKDNKITKANYDLFNFSVAHLFSPKGNMYEKGISRISAGTLSLFEGKTKIQPVLYLKDFFKSVTPGIRLVQSF
jgi:hypothetical protein